jgi:hypothetical protein
MTGFTVSLVILVLLAAFVFYLDAQGVIDGITNRFDQHRLRWRDKVLLRTMYRAMVFAGRWKYPEASSILWHYMCGSGEDLHLDSAYFRKSPLIMRKLAGRPGGRVTLRIDEDPRIAYAVNGFLAEERGGTLVIHERIVFDRRRGGDYTPFRVLKKRVVVPDRLVYVFEETGGCKPYTVFIQ